MPLALVLIILALALLAAAPIAYVIVQIIRRFALKKPVRWFSLKNVLLFAPLLVIGLYAAFTLFVFYELTTHIHRENASLTYAQAHRKLPNFPFPASSHDIYFAEVSSGQQYFNQIVRFSAPLEACKKCADQILADFRRQNPKVKTDFNSGKIFVKLYPELQNSPWFHPEQIDLEHGIFLTSENLYGTPQVWIDTKRQILYYYFAN